MAAVLLRARALSVARSREDLTKVFFWDNAYGLVALLWIVTGLLRLFGPVDKGTDYYVGNVIFWVKMTLFLGVFLLELLPMVTFLKWRIAVKRGGTVDLDGLRERLLRHHYLEAFLLMAVAIAAATMARGVGGMSGSVSATRVAALSSTTTAAVARGEVIYRERCAVCHGIDGRGQGGRLAADFVGDPSRLRKSDDTLLDSISHGVQGSTMPSFAQQLRLEDRRDVLAYIRHSFGRSSAH
jgi:putative membrane protein